MVGSCDRVMENVCLQTKHNFESSRFQLISFIRLKRFKVHLPNVSCFMSYSTIVLIGEQNVQRTCRENFKCRLERSDSKELSL